MAELVVNVDHVATLREAREISYPDPVAAAIVVETAGADGIVVHLREDRRHIRERDVRILKEVVQTRLIFEMASTPKMIDIALEISPDYVTLVPEKRQELTTEGGLNIIDQYKAIQKTILILKNSNIRVCLFVDPEVGQIKKANEFGADMVEIHTGAFCDASSGTQKEHEFLRITNAVSLADKLKMGVNAGHGICYNTIKSFKGLSQINEFSIGHSIVSRSILTGMYQAVRDMKKLVEVI
jgi:pyridoxine 5-phosphate synthase